MMDKISISIAEYRQLVIARHTLELVYALMAKELDAKDELASTYVHGDKYMDIIDTYFDVMGVENAGQTEDF